ncbi:autoinducer binding domain-containing protein [Pseudomonas sp. NPDC089401]|uniref:autoinducer binding domain-containing protein n=1 Tax=Pseudomonas sp. NPDC089401 TaxID=3364462 RepID=UPI0038291848
MLDRIAKEWQCLSHLSAQLKELKAFAEELGFHYYSFAFTSSAHSINPSNLLPGGDPLVQAALEFRPARLRHSSIPLVWEPKAFAQTPLHWPEAQKLGLRHGWIQPLHYGAAPSSFALLRPHVSVSINELYQKAATVMWLAKHLHLAAMFEAGVTDTHALYGPSCAR